jgi:hypothetical protein
MKMTSDLADPKNIAKYETLSDCPTQGEGICD